ncbi:WXG100 family type VII secretion target [Mycobacterium sp. MS1601]|uniref:WXG100 family type VII secretion target n=1 Tax=Mycobacterium sp. MS1601 TaxID=1936029 RepID=UPI0012F83239|nr:hypothetical protein [Mycobacterium sp. MS1601]
MPKNLRVDISGLQTASNGVSDEQSALSAHHSQAVSGVTSAASGWIGSSAAALGELTSSWERTTTRQSTSIEGHAGDMGTAAQLFAYLEDRNAARLRAVHQGSPPSP